MAEENKANIEEQVIRNLRTIVLDDKIYVVQSYNETDAIVFDFCHANRSDDNGFILDYEGNEYSKVFSEQFLDKYFVVESNIPQEIFGYLIYMANAPVEYGLEDETIEFMQENPDVAIYDLVRYFLSLILPQSLLPLIYPESESDPKKHLALKKAAHDFQMEKSNNEHTIYWDEFDDYLESLNN